MSQWWTFLWRRGAKRARVLRAPLQLEPLEERNLLSGLVFVPSPQVNGGSLGPAAAIAANDIWAVGGISISNGSGEQTLAEHFNGTSWNVVPTSAPASNPKFTGVAAAASNDVWAVGAGNDGNAFIEHWNGTSWSVVSTQAGTNLSGVTAPASNNAWAVGSISGSSNALVEHWDGTRWSIVSSPAFAGVSVSAISADSPNDVWAVGGNGALHWNGTSWSVIPAANFGLGFTFAAVTALSPTNVWGDGNSTIPGGEYHKFEGTVEHWDGTSWSVVSLNKQITGTDLQGIAAVSANDIYAVGDNGSETLAEHWNGSSLQIVPSPNPNFGNGLFGVTALSDGTVAAFGYQENSSFVQTPLILQNSASAPKSWKTATAPAATMPAPLDAASVTSSGATNLAPTKPMQVSLDRAPLDQFFATAGRADQPFIMEGQQTVAASTMMQPSNGMVQLAGAVLMQAQIDAFFQMLDARLISLESTIVARMPQLDGMIQSFNAMMARVESAIAGHPIDDLSGKV
jgi:hypothetical protein